MYDTVGLAFIEPELRENRGEVEAAQEGKLPVLINLDNLRGDLHSHTTETDGRNSLEEMARAARDRGMSIWLSPNIRKKWPWPKDWMPNASKNKSKKSTG